ncbi:MAG TPA: FkbM family methyltransferase [Gemmataceae bacterium]|nr:FkbM family methyltransferase [Gemmataceae bacterium]
MKKVIKRVIEKLTGNYILNGLPTGVDVFYDLRACLPKFSAQLVFDVGANEGQSAAAFLRGFPRSKIYCFEPVSSTFKVLTANFGGHQNIHCCQVALGSETGSRQIMLLGSSDNHSLAPLDEGPVANGPSARESVRVETVTQFCKSQGIMEINYLKIDTEGHDLQVLRGAEAMLADKKIDLIQVEAGMNRHNTKHVPLDVFMQYLEPMGYFIFRIYEQVSETFTREPHLRRANPVFVSKRIIDAHRLSL